MTKAEQGRYIILGSIDGILAVLGGVIGASTAGTPNEGVVQVGIGVAVALAVTNGIGSYLAESTVEYAKLAEKERPLLRRLTGTKIERVTKRKIYLDSITHGGASFVGSLVPIVPFMTIESNALAVSISASLSALVVLGIYSGRLSKQNIAVSVVKMVILGVLVVVLVSLLGGGH
jgi:predicted membrane protein (TIGR00267 family)